MAITAIIATSTACVAQGAITCLVAGIASLLVLVDSSFSGQPTGQTGDQLPTKRSRDMDSALDGLKVWHDAGNGVVKNFLDVKSLEVGINHDVWDNYGMTARLRSRVDTGLQRFDRKQIYCYQTPSRWRQRIDHPHG